METKKIRLFLITGLVVLLGAVKTADAALLGLQAQYPSVSTLNTYLIYDSDGVDRSTGLLSVVALGSALNSGPYPSPSLSQSYTAGELLPTPALMLTFAIRKSNGAWNPTTANGANKVSISFGNNAATNGGFSWTGDVTNFGWSEGADYGKYFEATWKMADDSYMNMPSNMSQFVDGVLTNAMAAYEGGIKISNSAGFGNVPHPKAFQRDWIFGTAAINQTVQTILSNFTGGLSDRVCRKFDSTGCLSIVNSTVFAEVFVPIPPAVWLWAGALSTLIPSMRRIKTNNPFAKKPGVVA